MKPYLHINFLKSGV